MWAGQKGKSRSDRSFTLRMTASADGKLSRGMTASAGREAKSGAEIADGDSEFCGQLGRLDAIYCDNGEAVVARRKQSMFTGDAWM